MRTSNFGTEDERSYFCGDLKDVLNTVTWYSISISRCGLDQETSSCLSHALMPRTRCRDGYNDDALVLPYCDYCSAIWGNCSKGMSNRLQILQNRTARLITHSDHDRRSSQILCEVGWDDLEKQRRIQLTIVMYKVLYGMTPDHVINIFKNTNDMYYYNLRHSGYNVLYQDHAPKLQRGSPLSGITCQTILKLRPASLTAITNALQFF